MPYARRSMCRIKDSGQRVICCLMIPNYFVTYIPGLHLLAFACISWLASLGFCNKNVKKQHTLKCDPYQFTACVGLVMIVINKHRHHPGSMTNHCSVPSGTATHCDHMVPSNHCSAATAIAAYVSCMRKPKRNPFHTLTLTAFLAATRVGDFDPQAIWPWPWPGAIQRCTARRCWNDVRWQKLQLCSSWSERYGILKLHCRLHVHYLPHPLTD